MRRAPTHIAGLTAVALSSALSAGCAAPDITTAAPKRDAAVAFSEDAAVIKPGKQEGGPGFALPQSADGGDGSASLSENICAGTGSGTAEPKKCADFGVQIDPFYRDRYSCFYLGPVPGVPESKYGGLTLTQDRCSTTLLIGGDANDATGMLYSIRVTRDARGHINGFSEKASSRIAAPHNDGGVVYGPGGVLFLARWPANQLQQTKAGSTQSDKVIDLGKLNVAYASAGLGFVPDTLPGAGRFKLVSWSGGQWYDLAYRPDGNGMYDVTAANPVKVPGGTGDLSLPGGPEGFVYVAAGSPLFPKHSMLVSEWTGNAVSTYEIDAAGDPKTWQGGQEADRVIVVRGFAPIVVN